MSQGHRNQISDTNVQSSDAVALKNALQAIVDEFGVDKNDIGKLLQGISAGQKVVDDIQQPKLHKDKELIYDDPSCYIYRRNNTKNKYWYYRHYDKDTRQRYVKSLATTDHTIAITAARVIYQQVKSKVLQGHKLKNISTPELINLFLKREQLKISDIPKQGITPKVYKTKVITCRYWQWFIDDLKYTKTAIDQIPLSKVRDFGYWLMILPKFGRGSNNTSRSPEVVNNCITTIMQMYRDVGVRDGYISSDKVPVIDKLSQKNDGTLKRDILSLEQYDKLWRWMQYKYCKESDIDDRERQKRVIFSKLVGVLSNTGLRSSELLGLKVNDVYPNPLDKDKDTDNMLVRVTPSNSKTGVGRTLVAPIKKRIVAIKEAYAELGMHSSPNDYLFRSTQGRGKVKSFSRETLANRFKQVLQSSGLQDEIDAEGMIINLYSLRHQYISWRIRYGNVPLPLLSRAVGNSVQVLMQKYAHIQVESQADVLTKAQGFLKMSETDLSTNLYNSDDDYNG